MKKLFILDNGGESFDRYTIVNTEESIFNSFADLGKSFNKIMPIAAIYLNAPVKTSTEKTARIKEGDLIRVEAGWITDVEPDKEPTHEIILCEGNIASTVLQVQIKDLKTNELSTLKLK